MKLPGLLAQGVSDYHCGLCVHQCVMLPVMEQGFSFCMRLGVESVVIARSCDGPGSQRFSTKDAPYRILNTMSWGVPGCEDAFLGAGRILEPANGLCLQCVHCESNGNYLTQGVPHRN